MIEPLKTAANSDIYRFFFKQEKISEFKLENVSVKAIYTLMVTTRKKRLLRSYETIWNFRNKLLATIIKIHKHT